MRIYFKFYFYILSTLFIVISCNPEDDSINPEEYELYITISSDRYPSVSPDGEWIAYFHQSLEYPEPQDYRTGLYIMDKNGKNIRCLLEGYHIQPSWSPDGKWLVFSSSGILQIMSLNGDSIRTFTGIGELPLFFPDWSSDGENIIFSAPLTIQGGVYIMSPDFNVITRVLNPIENNGMYAKFSPDGNNIVYQKGNQSYSSVEIFTLNLLTMMEIRLTQDNHDDRSPSWSPKNSLIAWSSNVKICRMNTDGSNRISLDYGQYPSWTPDGECIVYSFASLDFKKEVIWKIDIDGKNKIQLTF